MLNGKGVFSCKKEGWHLAYSCLKCFISGDGIELQVMSERLAKQEQLATRKQHIVSFPYAGFRTYHLHMHKYKEVHICKWISSEEAFQLTAFIKQQQLNVKCPGNQYQAQ